jgi:hypothetical protein|tara:strand:+ start:5391 stop:5543 length:153 start_codon:yes stop_codon:yes gene_type:complete
MATIGEKEIKTNYPVVEGLTARTQRQTGRKTQLKPQEKSLIRKNETIGFT